MPTTSHCYRVERPDGTIKRAYGTLARARFAIEGKGPGWLVSDEHGVVLAFRGDRREALAVSARNEELIRQLGLTDYYCVQPGEPARRRRCRPAHQRPQLRPRQPRRAQSAAPCPP